MLALRPLISPSTVKLALVLSSELPPFAIHVKRPLSDDITLSIRMSDVFLEFVISRRSESRNSSPFFVHEKVAPLPSIRVQRKVTDFPAVVDFGERVSRVRASKRVVV